MVKMYKCGTSVFLCSARLFRARSSRESRVELTAGPSAFSLDDLLTFYVYVFFFVAFLSVFLLYDTKL